MIGLSPAHVGGWSLEFNYRLNSAYTAADSPDTRQREIVGGKRRSMNRSDIRMREYLCRRLSAARRRKKYEPGFRRIQQRPGEQPRRLDVTDDRPLLQRRLQGGHFDGVDVRVVVVRHERPGVGVLQHT